MDSAFEAIQEAALDDEQSRRLIERVISTHDER
jgi:hypothetical protein